MMLQLFVTLVLGVSPASQARAEDVGGRVLFRRQGETRTLTMNERWVPEVRVLADDRGLSAAVYWTQYWPLRDAIILGDFTRKTCEVFGLSSTVESSFLQAFRELMTTHYKGAREMAIEPNGTTVYIVTDDMKIKCVKLGSTGAQWTRSLSGLGIKTRRLSDTWWPVLSVSRDHKRILVGVESMYPENENEGTFQKQFYIVSADGKGQATKLGLGEFGFWTASNRVVIQGDVQDEPPYVCSYSITGERLARKTFTSPGSVDAVWDGKSIVVHYQGEFFGKHASILIWFDELLRKLPVAPVDIGPGAILLMGLR